MKWVLGGGMVLVACAMTACDQAKDLLDTASGDGELPKPGGEVEERLAGMVRRTGTGVTFRRDLTFPTRLSGRLSVELDHDDVRVVEESALGNETRTLDHKTVSEIRFGKAAGEFSLKLEKLRRRLLETDDGLQSKPGARRDMEGLSLEFLLGGDGWRPRNIGETDDLATRIWADNLTEHVPSLLVETGAYPRTQWFSSSREWRDGDRLVLTGSTVKVLNPFDVSGRLELVFQGEEAVGGHPCGVFRVSGDMNVRSAIGFDGETRDTDISISEGTIWASLLYPVLLREEYDTVQTITRGGDGGPTIRTRGRIRVTKQRSWVPGSA